MILNRTESGIDKFEASEMYSWYKSNKPYIDRCQILNKFKESYNNIN